MIFKFKVPNITLHRAMDGHPVLHTPKYDIEGQQGTWHHQVPKPRPLDALSLANGALVVAEHQRPLDHI